MLHDSPKFETNLLKAVNCRGIPGRFVAKSPNYVCLLLDGVEVHLQRIHTIEKGIFKVLKLGGLAKKLTFHLRDKEIQLIRFGVASNIDPTHQWRNLGVEK